MSISLKANSDGSAEILNGVISALKINTDGSLEGTTIDEKLRKDENIILGVPYVIQGTETYIDFGIIPEGVKRITVMFDGVSTSGTSPIIIQLGIDNSVFQTTGYKGQANNVDGRTVMSSGFVVASAVIAAETYHGSVCIDRVFTNTWSERGAVMQNTTVGNGTFSGGSVNLSSDLSGIRITTVNGTDTFDAGMINISWEF